MAIEISSKHIYEIDNPKIIDNEINNVKISTKQIAENNEYDVKVFTEDKEVIKTTDEEAQEGYSAKAFVVMGSQTQGSVDSISAKVASSYCFNKKTSNFYLKIPILLINKYISVLRLGKNEETNENNIKTTSIGYINRYSASSTWSCSGTGSTVGTVEKPTVNTSDISYRFLEDNSKNPNQVFKLPTRVISTVPDTELELNPKNVSYELEVIDNGNLGEATAKKITENGVDYFEMNVTILHSFSTVSLVGKGSNIGSRETTVEMKGERFDYISKFVEISVYGNTIGISLEDNSITFGNGNKPHSLDGNELMQQRNRIGNQNAIEYLANNVMLQYANGKETATLLCDIGEYYEYYDKKKFLSKSTKEFFLEVALDDSEFSAGLYNVLGDTYIKFNYIPLPFDYQVAYSYTKNGASEHNVTTIEKGTTNTTILVGGESDTITNLVIQMTYRTISMKFEIGDEVIPMVCGADGTDRPMSRYPNGKAKEFRVVGTKNFYDGAVWQKISLQEI